MLASVLATIVSTGRALGFDRADEVALLFCGSQKSLVSGVPIANALASGAAVGPLLLPIMLYHPMQLLVCTWVARFLPPRRATGRTSRGVRTPGRQEPGVAAGGLLATGPQPYRPANAPRASASVINTGIT